jgi:ASC-1-like (ASCH) protein
MNKSWNLIPKIVSGQKSIESRWYQTKRAPWNKIKIGDRVFFKNSSELVIASAEVSKVFQFELNDKYDAKNLIEKYNKKICLLNSNLDTWGKLPRYCILMFLKKAKYLDQPFKISKKGWGTGTAWLADYKIPSEVR